MADFRNIASLEELVERYPWFTAARLRLLRERGIETADAFSRLLAELHPTATIKRQEIDVETMCRLSTGDIIDRFLKRNDYRITAEEGDADDISKVEIEDVDDLVSEELAELYANQHLYAEAIDTYRKLSLLNSEKSIYFAGLIAQLERKQNQKE
ncbi:MAG: hypothetical protein IKB24_00830 [Alistipes sp.]|nr:hypothetical protein [Alistipes sp.]MBR2436052.1 hypothetical protein [Alistipes sp.]